jgi:hypothetical protein
MIVVVARNKIVNKNTRYFTDEASNDLRLPLNKGALTDDAFTAEIS